ncbi:MAG: hypothetical protein AAF682_29400 [Planctomycetota bacterium]
MTVEIGADVSAHPARAQLLADFGEDYLSIQSLFRFCFVPSGRLGLLKDLAVVEEWGANDFVLLKYLAVHVRFAIEQGRYVWNGDQIVINAGRLVTATGAPIYAGIVKNNTPDENPWVLNWVGERPSCAELPEPPDLGPWPTLAPGLEVIIACDLDGDDRPPRLPGLAGVPVVTRMAALAGAVQWSLYRGLAVRQLHGAGRGFFVPVYLSSREDLTAAPDVVAPIVTQGERLVVRTLLEPHVAYAPARAVVERCELIAPWLLEAWEAAAEEGREAD